MGLKERLDSKEEEKISSRQKEKTQANFRVAMTNIRIHFHSKSQRRQSMKPQQNHSNPDHNKYLEKGRNLQKIVKLS